MNRFENTIFQNRPVLILDGSQRSALAVTRSLGRRGIPVTVGDEQLESLAGASKYCQERWAYPSPSGDARAFCEAVKAKCDRDRIGVLIPMADRTLEAVLKHRAYFQNIALPFGDLKAFLALTDKAQLHAIADSLGIRMPRTMEVSSILDLKSDSLEWQFPLVVKPALPHTRRQGFAMPKVRYVFNVAELHEAAQRYLECHEGPVLVQEFVEGEGIGVFQLCDHGRPVVVFSHRRIREKPPSGGVSVLSESIPVSPQLRRMTEQLLAAVGWHGVAMTEWKVPAIGPPCLLEINARFWGSLQLAVDAGVDFPWLLYQMALGVTPEVPATYRAGIRSRWLLGDLDQLYMRLCKSDGVYQASWRNRVESVLGFFRLINPNLYYDVNRMDDLGPFWFEIRQYIGAVAS